MNLKIKNKVMKNKKARALIFVNSDFQFYCWQLTLL